MGLQENISVFLVFIGLRSSDRKTDIHIHLKNKKRKGHSLARQGTHFSKLNIKTEEKEH